MYLIVLDNITTIGIYYVSNHVISLIFIVYRGVAQKRKCLHNLRKEIKKKSMINNKTNQILKKSLAYGQ